MPLSNNPITATKPWIVSVWKWMWNYYQQFIVINTKWNQMDTTKSNENDMQENSLEWSRMNAMRHNEINWNWIILGYRCWHLHHSIWLLCVRIELQEWALWSGRHFHLQLHRQLHVTHFIIFIDILTLIITNGNVIQHTIIERIKIYCEL